jgi:signal peptidase I
VTEHPTGSEEPAGGFTLSEPRPAERAERGSFLRELPILFIVALAVAIVLKTLVVQAFFIPSSSMEPTLVPGDRVLVQKVVYGPDRGDVIVFSDPQGRPGPDRGVVGGFVHWLSSTLGIERPEHEDFIKRAIGLPARRSSCGTGDCSSTGSRSASPT